MAPPSPSDFGMPPDDGTPDLSHLSEEERQIILQVLQRQKAEERQEEEIAQKGDKELWDIERQIQERKVREAEKRDRTYEGGVPDPDQRTIVPASGIA